MSHPESKVWFVTGASSGLGRAVVIHLLEQGENVVATLRKPTDIIDLTAKYSDVQLFVVALDVVSPADITAAFASAIEKFGRVDIVYNNAGIAAMAEVEGTPDDVARRLFEVNFWGSTNVAREAIRIFRDVNKPRGGRLLQASSIAGTQGMAAIGYYSASKYALEGISEALAHELHPSWNIKVTIVEIGSFKTRIVHQNMSILPPHPAYNTPDSVTTAMRNLFGGEGIEGGCDPNKGAQAIYNIARDNSVGLRVPLGPDSLELVALQAKKILQEVEAARKWSTDLTHDTAA